LCLNVLGARLVRRALCVGSFPGLDRCYQGLARGLHGELHRFDLDAYLDLQGIELSLDVGELSPGGADLLGNQGPRIHRPAQDQSRARVGREAEPAVHTQSRAGAEKIMEDATSTGASYLPKSVDVGAGGSLIQPK